MISQIMTKKHKFFYFEFPRGNKKKKKGETVDFLVTKQGWE